MPTILDQLSIELGWDLKKFLEGAKQIEKTVKDRKDDFEKQSKVWEFVLGNLSRALTRVTVAFLSIEAAIRGIDATRTLSRTGTEFANLADTVGMSVQQLSQWEQALERVGGNAREAGEAFSFQQSELQKTKTGLQGAPSFLGYMQRLGMPDWNSYYNQTTKQFDLDRFNKDLSDAMNRQNLSASQRAEYLKGFGWNSPSAQRLFAGDLRNQLDATKNTAMTEANMETFRRLNEQWTKLGQVASAVSRDLITFLETPITKFITALENASRAMGGFLKSLEGARYIGPGSQWPTWDNPLGLTPPRHPIPGIGSVGGAIIQAPTSRPSGPSWLPWPLGTWGERNPATPAPGGGGAAAPGGGASFQDRFGAAPTTTVTPSLPPGYNPPGMPGGVRSTPGTTNGFTPPVTGSRSSLEPFTTLGRSSSQVAAAAGALVGSVTTNTNSSVTIGAMSFNSRASDTAMGAAPSGVQKDLSVGSYAPHANESLE